MSFGCEVGRFFCFFFFSGRIEMQGVSVGLVGLMGVEFVWEL